MGRGDRALAPRPSTLRAPVLVAPMYAVSGPELVIAACRAGLVGSLPSRNALSLADLADWLDRISAVLSDAPQPVWAVALISNPAYERLSAELRLIAAKRPPLVLTALGSPARAVQAVRGYGGSVFAEVATVEQALKAADAGADGLVLAPGRRSALWSFLDQVRRFFGGPLAVAGGLRTGGEVWAARALGAQLAEVGARFAHCAEARVDERRAEILDLASRTDNEAASVQAGVPTSWVSEGHGASAGGETTVEKEVDRLIEEYRAASRGYREYGGRSLA